MALRAAQQAIVDAPHRFKVVVAGRRFGKTHLAIRELCRHARLPNKEVWYVAPTYRQSKMIVWRKLKNKLVALRWASKINESDLSIVLKNGSTISLKGADNADNLRGVGLDYLVMDEFAEIDKTAWFEVLRPTLADKQGGALFIGTPKGFANWAHDLYMMESRNPQWCSFQYTTIDGGNVPAEEIEAAKQDLDLRSFRQEFLATFEEYAGRIYYGFDRKHNVTPYDGSDDGTVLIGMDFNIDPMSAVVCVRQGETLYVIDEIRMFSSNTQEIVEEIKSRYPSHKVWVYPDPSARAKKTSAGGATDITILQNAGFIVKAPNSHNPVRDRINSVNSKLLNTAGVRTLFVTPNCKHTIDCLEKQTYKQGTTQPNKDGGHDHMNDALGYLVDYLWPVKRNTPHNPNAPTRWTHGITRN